MIHDPELTDRLAQFASETFSGVVFRATRANLDPLAFSHRAGRWMPENGTAAVLYTSVEREGALAEIAFHWSQLTPVPTKPVSLHRLEIQTHKTLRLLRGELGQLDVDLDRFGDMFYGRTQEIGAAVAFLGHDGLIAPSARWSCDNLMVFQRQP
ncbi:MAG TPA: RES family NAD+ phosphorylase [Acetobacteraceae bacterium]|nr:RES family NAD+ phosphorylase [Acetobacteraceae bacterium]